MQFGFEKATCLFAHVGDMVGACAKRNMKITMLGCLKGSARKSDGVVQETMFLLSNACKSGSVSMDATSIMGYRLSMARVSSATFAAPWPHRSSISRYSFVVKLPHVWDCSTRSSTTATGLPEEASGLRSWW